jgi:3-methyl-2-oxobutanoate hydroxymethyltransferase
VTNDLLGLYEKFLPKFVKQYAQLYPRIREAIQDYVREVKAGGFPGPEHSFCMDPQDLEPLQRPQPRKKK